MFKKLKEMKRKSKYVSGLSKGMMVVDELMTPGLRVRTLDQNYGRADMALKMMRQYNELTDEELNAALVTLDNQYEKLRKKAWVAQLYE